MKHLEKSHRLLSSSKHQGHVLKRLIDNIVYSKKGYEQDLENKIKVLALQKTHVHLVLK